VKPAAEAEWHAILTKAKPSKDGRAKSPV